jgi:hypothetical protein
MKTLQAEKARLAPAEERSLTGDDPAVAQRSVPRAKAMDRLRRYERALERDFDRAMGELERLQRARRATAARSGAHEPGRQARDLSSEEPLERQAPSGRQA